MPANTICLQPHESSLLKNKIHILIKTMFYDQSRVIMIFSQFDAQGPLLRTWINFDPTRASQIYSEITHSFPNYHSFTTEVWE